MTDPKNKKFIIRCECGDDREHAIHVDQYNSGHISDDNRLGQCVVSLSMNQYRPWYKRIIPSFKYLFGSYSGCDYVETIVDVEVLKELVNSLEDYRSDEEKKEAKKRRDDSVYKVL